MTATKGVHTAIQALGQLRVRDETRVHLDLVGGGEPAYESYLRNLVHELGVEAFVTFCGGASHADMARILAQHHVLLLLSQWEEPFARVVLEAMAAGLVVLGTLTGGTGEILVEGETGLTFTAGDSAGLADQIQRLLDDPQRRHRLA